MYICSVEDDEDDLKMEEDGGAAPAVIDDVDTSGADADAVAGDVDDVDWEEEDKVSTAAAVVLVGMDTPSEIGEREVANKGLSASRSCCFAGENITFARHTSSPEVQRSTCGLPHTYPFQFTPQLSIILKKSDWSN